MGNRRRLERAARGQVGAQELRKKEQRDSREAAKGAAAWLHPALAVQGAREKADRGVTGKEGLGEPRMRAA